MFKRKQLLLAMFFLSSYPCSVAVLATEPVDNNVVTIRRIQFPFGHVDIARHKDGSNDVDVKAPFTKVHNPAGPDNAQVKAPLYKEDHVSGGTVNNVKAPSPAAQKSADKKQQK